MDKIDKILFGDNQFFAINHRSTEKMRELSERFDTNEKIINVYDIAFDAGIDAVMLNSNARAVEICDYFRKNHEKYDHIKWYPSIPYPYKYANQVAEKGIFPAITDILFRDNSINEIYKLLSRGASVFLCNDGIKLMQILIDTELMIFRGLNIRVVFLQNIITDLILGFGVGEIFQEYCKYLRKRYNVIPGFITQNMPLLKNKLSEWEIYEVVICTSLNKIGYLMSPDIHSYLEAIQQNDPSQYQIMAMSTMASGAIRPDEAYDFINSLRIQSVVFGASSGKNIRETISMIKI